MLCACTHQGRTLRTQQEGCPLQAKERVLIRNQTTALIWTSFLQSHEKEMSAVWPLLVVLVMQLKLTELGGHTGRGHSAFSRSTEALMLIHHSLSGGHCFQDRAQGQYSWFPFCFLPLGVCSGPFIHALICLLRKCLWSAQHILGTDLPTGGSTINKIVSALMAPVFQWRKPDNKQVNNSPTHELLL